MEKEVDIYEFDHEEEEILDAIGANKSVVDECVGRLAREEGKISKVVEYAIETSDSVNTIIGVCYMISRMTAQTQRLLQAAQQLEEHAKQVEQKDDPGMLYG